MANTSSAEDKISLEVEGKGAAEVNIQDSNVKISTLEDTAGGPSFTMTKPTVAVRSDLKEKEVEQDVLSKRTIIRFKRRIEDSPAKILVVSYKRAKLDVDKECTEDSGVGTSASAEGASASSVEEDVCSQVLRLVGTVPEIEADSGSVAATVRSVLETSSPSVVNSLRRNVKAVSRRTMEKTRAEQKQTAEANRFKIVSSKRGVKLEDKGVEQAAGSVDNDLLKLLDLVPETNAEKAKTRLPPENFMPGSVTCNGVPMVKEVSEGYTNDDEKGYVYDLYLTNDPCLEEKFSGQFVSVEEGDEEIDFGEYRDDAIDDNYLEDDDDSNAEDNWRNEYPDDDDDYENKVFDGDGAYNVEKFSQLGMEDDSSDDELIYGIDEENYSMSFDQKYQKYKLKFQNEYADEVVSSEDEDSDLQFE